MKLGMHALMQSCLYMLMHEKLLEVPDNQLLTLSIALSKATYLRYAPIQKFHIDTWLLSLK